MGARELIFTILAIDKASAELERIGLAAEGSGARLGKFGKLATGVLGGMTLAAAAVSVEGVKMASSFQAEMEMIHTQAGASQKTVDDLSGKVLNLAGKVGEGPQSLATALYHIQSSFASTGITGERAMKLLETSAKGAKIGHADLVDVTNALDAAVVSGIPGVKNFDQAMGALNATVGSGDMHMQDLADAFGTGVLANVKQYGLSLRDVGAGLATFGDNNIRGAVAGTQLRMSVQSLAVPAKKGAGYLRSIGLEADSLSKDMQKGGLSLALTDLVTHMRKAGVTSKESGQFITEAFGKKAGGGLAILVDQIDRVKSKYGEIDKQASNFGEAWAGTQATFKQQWDELRATLDSLLVQLGLKLIPKLQAAAKWISEHQTLVLALVGSLGALLGSLAAVGLAIKVYEAAVIVTRAWTLAQEALNIAMFINPVGVIVLAIAALVAVIVLAYQHWGAFRQVVDTAWAWIKAAFGTAVAWIETKWAQFRAGIDAAAAWMQALPGRIGGALAGLPAVIGGWLKTAAERAAYWFGYGVGVIVREAMALPGRIMAGIRALPGLVTGLFSALWHGAVSAVTSMWHGIVSVISSVRASVTSGSRSAVSAGVSAFQQLPGKVMGFLRGLPGQIRGVFSGAGTWLAQAGRDIVNGLVNGVRSAAGGAMSAVRGLGGQMMSGFKSAMGISSPSKKFAEIGRWIPAGIAMGIEQNRDAAIKKVQQLGAQINATGNRYAASLVSSMGSKLIKLGTLHESLVAKMTAAKSNLAALQKDALQLASDTTGKMIDLGSVTAAPGTDSGSIVRHLQAALVTAKTFSSTLAQLRARGLDSTSISQLAAAGPDQGLAAAQGILRGGSGNIRLIASMQKQLAATSTAGGRTVSDAMYGAGISAAQGLVKGLQSQENAVVASITHLSSVLVASVKKALRIKSPSGVFADEVGAMIPAGIAHGITRGMPLVTTALGGVPVTAPGLARSAGGGNVIHVHVTNAVVGNDEQLARTIEGALARSGRRGLLGTAA